MKTRENIKGLVENFGIVTAKYMVDTSTCDEVTATKNHLLLSIDEYATQFSPAWIPVSDRLPEEYGRYFVCRKDGKVHWEVWNGGGWAYNNSVITHWMHILPAPKLEGNK